MIIFAYLLSLVGFIGVIWCLIEAYGEDTTQGVLCMCVPFYAFYFAIAKIDPPKKWIILGMLVCGIVGAVLRAMLGEP